MEARDLLSVRAAKPYRKQKNRAGISEKNRTERKADYRNSTASVATAKPPQNPASTCGPLWQPR